MMLRALALLFFRLSEVYSIVSVLDFVKCFHVLFETHILEELIRPLKFRYESEYVNRRDWKPTKSVTIEVGQESTNFLW